MDTASILSLLKDVAAEVITPRFRALAQGEVQEKNPGDLVTVADHEAEVLITEALRAAYPDAVVLGEEAHAQDPSLLDRFRAADHAFTVDPVDGTKNFVHGSPDHAVMVSEVRDGQVERAWIWQPQHRTAYVAERGGGTWRDDVLIRRAPAGPAAVRTLRTSRRAWLGREVAGMPAATLTWLCCGVDYPHLLAGDADVVLYSRAHAWDHAPGSLLLTEAGAYLGTFDGTAYRPQAAQTPGLVAAADRATYDETVAGIRAEGGWG